jgi:deoxyribodipyrimidine photo-lyase
MTEAAPAPRTAVVLFTQDLRLHDHPALHAARARAEQVVPLFVLDPAVAAASFAAPNRMAFLADCLADLDGALRAAGSRLVVRHGCTVEQTARLAAETGADTVHATAGVSAFAARREAGLHRALGPRLHLHEGLTVVAAGALTPAGRDHYAVFTPYLRVWQQAARRPVLPAPRTLATPAAPRSAPLPAAPPGTSPALAAGGERRARRRLAAFDPHAYQDRRDAPGADATSRLSPYLHFGCLSPGELAHRATRAGTPGGQEPARQLAWRDFHHQVLAARPDAAHADYRPRPVRWHRDEDELRAWREGRTGYPIVDAGMRQLAHEGWMHNRARMLTASFLTKTLRHHWHEGAAHFLSLLVDGDIADNQLNWQWIAGTGTDTRPGRVLNPVRQGERHDPHGTYVRRWLPELAHLPDRGIHRPWLHPHPLDYPPPLVDPGDLTLRMREER